jgi:hypothetical protein
MFVILSPWTVTACEPTSCSDLCADERDDCLSEATSEDGDAECRGQYEECFWVCAHKDDAE